MNMYLRNRNTKARQYWITKFQEVFPHIPLMTSIEFYPLLLSG